MAELTASVLHSITEAKRGEWNAIVTQQSRTGSVFERYEWLAAYEAAHDDDPRHVQVRKNGTLVGVHPAYVRSAPGVPVRFLGPPRPEYNGVMAATDEADVLRVVLDVLDGECGWRTVGHLLKPCSGRSLRYANVLRSAGYVPTVRGCQFHVDIDRSWDDVLAGVDGKKRKKFRQADEAGVVTERRELSRETVAAFHEKHRQNMARIGGEEVSEAFLQALVEHLGDRVEIFGATVDGQALGDLFVVADREQDQLHLLFPGYLEAGFRYDATESLYRAAMQWGIEEGLGTCNFGETEPDLADGTFAFKQAFGGTAVPTLRWERVHSLPLRAFYRLGGEAVVGRLFDTGRRLVGGGGGGVGSEGASHRAGE